MSEEHSYSEFQSNDNRPTNVVSKDLLAHSRCTGLRMMGLYIIIMPLTVHTTLRVGMGPGTNGLYTHFPIAVPVPVPSTVVLKGPSFVVLSKLRLLGAGVLDHSLGSLRHGVFGQFSGEEQQCASHYTSVIVIATILLVLPTKILKLVKNW